MSSFLISSCTRGGNSSAGFVLHFQALYLQPRGEGSTLASLLHALEESSALGAPRSAPASGPVLKAAIPLPP